MHIRDLVIWFITAAAACASSPDPRARSIEFVARDGHGGWIEITTAQRKVAGELIAVELQGLRVLVLAPRPALVLVAKAEIKSARLWPWDTEHGSLLAWGLSGTLSTLSHGFLLIFSVPVWLVTTGAATSFESVASRLEYPDDGWDKFAVWARFPQGLPLGVRDQDLIHQERAAPPPAPAPAPSPSPSPAPSPPSPAPASLPAPSPPAPSPPAPSPPASSPPASSPPASPATASPPMP